MKSTRLARRVTLAAVASLVFTVVILAILSALFVSSTYRGLLKDDLSRQLAHVQEEWAVLESTERGFENLEVLIDAEPFSTRFVTYAVTPTQGIVAESSGPRDIQESVANDPGSLLAIPTTSDPLAFTIGDTVLAAVSSPLESLPDIQIVIVGSIDSLQEEAFRLALVIGVIGLICAVAGSVITRIVLTRTVRPIDQLAAQTSKVDAGELAQITVPDSPMEARTLAVEINHLLTRIEDDKQERRQFLATISHEMRTPIAIARGHLELLDRMDGTSTDEMRSGARRAISELDRATTLVSAVLTLARSAEPGFIRPQSTSLESLAADLTLRTSALPIRVSVAAAPDLSLECDQERMTQAILNLVTNSQLHNDAHVSSWIRWEITPDFLIIHVDDDGNGFTDPIPEQLLQPFVSDDSVGSGLGLAVVSTILAAHSGEVRLTNLQPHGARVSLYLPLPQ